MTMEPEKWRRWPMIKCDIGDLVCFRLEERGWHSEVMLGIVTAPENPQYALSYNFYRIRATHGSTYLVSGADIISNLTKSTWQKRTSCYLIFTRSKYVWTSFELSRRMDHLAWSNAKLGSCSLLVQDRRIRNPKWRICISAYCAKMGSPCLYRLMLEHIVSRGRITPNATCLWRSAFQATLSLCWWASVKTRKIQLKRSIHMCRPQPSTLSSQSMAEWHRENCLPVFHVQRSGIVKTGNIIQDQCFPEDKGIILKIVGDSFLVLELTTAKVDWYHRKYIKTCRVVPCE